LYGIGLPLSQKILAKLRIDPNIRTKDLSEKDANRLREEIEKQYHVEGELRHEVKTNVRRLRDISCYRGTRHAKGLPVRGQRTKTNTRTVRGNTRKTMGSGRKKADSKT
jgi:small subunit ribosomal protein S13